jgi:hypothetical protein
MCANVYSTTEKAASTLLQASDYLKRLYQLEESKNSNINILFSFAHTQLFKQFFIQLDISSTVIKNKVLFCVSLFLFSGKHLRILNN